MQEQKKKISEWKMKVKKNKWMMKCKKGGFFKGGENFPDSIFSDQRNFIF